MRFTEGNWNFPIDELCFTIRKGIKLGYHVGSEMMIMSENGLLKTTVKVDELTFIRLSDLIEDMDLMRCWHMYDIGGIDPVKRIRDIYPAIHKDEIVTLVWFIVRE